ncbi:MAG: zinc ribbon domain-containing protein [Oscillospiraceae bacterium]|nr:zinc ribbon domain-containing protein [Oscillospiraceae bacterium]
MQICEKCGNQCFDNERYCSACGEQIKNRRQLQCDYCGNVAVDLKSNTCPSCGAKLAFDLITFTEKVRVCGCCGEKIAPGARFCGMCGARTVFGEIKAAEHKDTLRRRRTAVISLVIIGIIVLGISIISAVILHDERVYRESEEARISSYEARSEEQSRQEAEWAEAAKTADYTVYTAQELADGAGYVKVGDYVEVTGKLITRYHGYSANNMEIVANEENEGKGEVNFTPYESEMGDEFADSHAFGDTVTLRGRVSNVFPSIHVVWVTWYEEVTE